jgi:hypothetical protein
MHCALINLNYDAVKLLSYEDCSWLQCTAFLGAWWNKCFFFNYFRPQLDGSLPNFHQHFETAEEEGRIVRRVFRQGGRNHDGLQGRTAAGA